MSTTAPKSATTPLPVQLSEPECTAFILPHLSMPKRGPKCQLGYYRVFNLILWVLYTGMPWKGLPVPQDAQGKPAMHYTTVYKVLATWADDGSLWQAFVASVRHLWPRSRSICVCGMATGPIPWPKKGGWYRVLRGQTPQGRDNHRDHGQPWRCLSACPRGARQGDRHGPMPRGPERVEARATEVGLDLRGAYLNLDGGFDSAHHRPCICNAGMIPNITEHPGIASTPSADANASAMQ